MADEKKTIEDFVIEEVAQVEIPGEATLATLQEKGVEKPTYKEVHLARIQELAALAATAPAIVDKKSYEAVKAIRNTIVKARTGVDKSRKAIVGPMKQALKDVDEYLGTGADKGLQATIKALEVPLEAAEEKWEAQQEELKRKAEDMLRKRTAERTSLIVGYGAQLTGDTYTFPGFNIDEDAIDLTQLELMDDGPFEEWVAPVAAAFHQRRQAQEQEDANQRYREKALLDIGATRDGELLRIGNSSLTAATLGMLNDEAWDTLELNWRTQAIAIKRHKDQEQQAELRKVLLSGWGLQHDAGAGQWVYPRMADGAEPVEPITSEQIHTLEGPEWEKVSMATYAAVRAVDARLSQLADEQREFLDERYNTRITALEALGMRFDTCTKYHQLGRMQVTAAAVRNADKAAWEKMLGTFTQERDRLAAPPPAAVVAPAPVKPAPKAPEPVAQAPAPVNTKEAHPDIDRLTKVWNALDLTRDEVNMHIAASKSKEVRDALLATHTSLSGQMDGLFGLKAKLS